VVGGWNCSIDGRMLSPMSRFERADFLLGESPSIEMNQYCGAAAVACHALAEVGISACDGGARAGQKPGAGQLVHSG
jgi:hypothetical protein